MKLYNTLSKQLETIKPLKPPAVTVYTCGPTVYDYQHVGNWFTYIRYDLLIRALKANGFQPKWVLNITDVGHLVSDADEGEDKLEKGARREGKSAWEVAEFYTQDFLKGLKTLNITEPDYLPKATEHVREQIDLIKKLETLGYAYVIDDGVYYDTSKFPTYADFARLDMDEMQAGKRVSFNPQKRGVSDFALWKFSPSGHKRDMEWDSPWGKGFPGWHLECSAMAMKYLGETIDIHCGGIDHLPVHHTNEIAQSQAVTGKPLARHWLHTNHILFEDEKMAKSQGNIVTLQDIISKGHDPEALRLLVLQSHYRTQSKFSWDELEAAQKRLAGLYGLAALRWQATPSDALLNKKLFAAAVSEVNQALASDLSTPAALVTLSRLIDSVPSGLGAADLAAFNDFLAYLDGILGLKLSGVKDITDAQKDLIAKREQVRKADDWPEADKLRAQLTKLGISISDTPSGPIWAPIV
jgi:cysteinyl-tRNA synthetase